jgi:hypothetical protein
MGVLIEAVVVVVVAVSGFAHLRVVAAVFRVVVPFLDTTVSGPLPAVSVARVVMMVVLTVVFVSVAVIVIVVVPAATTAASTASSTSSWHRCCLCVS